MAVSTCNKTIVQHPIWLDGHEIYCDDAKLLNHLTHELKYNENDAARIIQQITVHLKHSLLYFWSLAAQTMDTEAIRVLLHSIEHSQLIYMLSYRDVYGYTALNVCADSGNNEVIKIILDSVSEEECYQLLSITDYRGWTPLHQSCSRGAAESVRVMLNYINQDMRYSLLQTRSNGGDTPLHRASDDDHTDVMKEIHESVTQTQWINLLQMKGYEEITVLHSAAYGNNQSCIDTIRDSVSDEEWLQLVSTPLPEYDESIHVSEYFYQGAVDWIDELRAAARVKSVFQIENHSGNEISRC